jgi:tetratricopeptide (TPR) repeat protein
MSRHPRCTRAALALVLTCAAVSAHAQPELGVDPAQPSDASEPTADATAPEQVAAYRDAVERGTTAFRAGRFLEARTAFELAYAMFPAPVLLFNVASCWRRLGDRDSALLAYRRFLAAAPADDPRRPLATETVGRLEAEERATAAAELAAQSVVLRERDRAPRRWSTTAKVGMGVAAIGAVGLVVGGIDAWRASARQDDFESLPAGTPWNQRQAQRYQEGKDAATRARIVGAAGAGAFVTGWVLIFVGGREHRRIEIEARGGGLQVAWRGRF